MNIPTLYTLVDGEGRFIYIDMGDIKYDRIPRKSMLVDEEEKIDRLMIKAERARHKNIDFCKNREEFEQKGSTSYNYYVKKMAALQALTFHLVKITFTTVEGEETNV